MSNNLIDARGILNSLQLVEVNTEDLQYKYLTDENGNVLEDVNGEPITNPDYPEE